MSGLRLDDRVVPLRPVWTSAHDAALRRAAPLAPVAKEGTPVEAPAPAGGSPGLIRGATQAYSKILGLTDSRKVRIEVKGKVCCVPFAPEVDRAFLVQTLVKDGMCRLWIDAVWRRQGDGSLTFVAKRSLVTRAEPWKPISGKEFLDRAAPLFRIPADAAEQIIADRREGRDDEPLPCHGTTHLCAGCGGEVLELVGHGRWACPRCGAKP